MNSHIDGSHLDAEPTCEVECSSVNHFLPFEKRKIFGKKILLLYIYLRIEEQFQFIVAYNMENQWVSQVCSIGCYA